MNERKRQAALASLAYIQAGQTVGIGTGSTVAYLIEALPAEDVVYVPSSTATLRLLQQRQLSVQRLHESPCLDLYIDGTDAIDDLGYLLKGGGAALTQEKLLAYRATQFVVIADDSKVKAHWHDQPCVLEVLAVARSAISRDLTVAGQRVVWQQGVLTDQGHELLHVYGLDFSQSVALEARLQQIPGCLECGLFARRGADVALIAGAAGIERRHYHVQA